MEIMLGKTPVQIDGNNTFSVSFHLKDTLSPESLTDIRQRIIQAFDNKVGKIVLSGIGEEDGWMVFSGSGNAWATLGIGMDTVLKDDFLFNSLEGCWWYEAGVYGERYDALEEYLLRRIEKKLGTGEHIPRSWERPKEPDPDNPEYYARFRLKKRLSEEDRKYITDYILDAFNNDSGWAENRSNVPGEFFFAGDTEDMLNCIADGLIALVDDDKVWKNIAEGEVCDGASFDGRYDILSELKSMHKRAKRIEKKLKAKAGNL